GVPAGLRLDSAAFPAGRPQPGLPRRDLRDVPPDDARRRYRDRNLYARRPGRTPGDAGGARPARLRGQAARRDARSWARRRGSAPEAAVLSTSIIERHLLTLPGSVTVAPEPLELLVQVRILARQPPGPYLPSAATLPGPGENVTSLR